MKADVEILMLEDQPADAELIRRYLQNGGLKFHLSRAETRDQFEQAIEERHPDIILSDHGLPAFDSLAAFSIAQKRCPEVPFIVVTGSAWDEMTLEALKRGADAFVAKDQLSHLVPKVQRSLHKRERENCLAALQEELGEARGHLQQLEQGIRDFYLCLLDTTGRITWSNKDLEITSGYSTPELAGQPFAKLFSREDQEAGRPGADLASAAKQGKYVTEARVAAQNKPGFWAQWTISVLRDSHNQLTGYACAGRDVTRRREVLETLRRSEENLRMLFESARDYALITIGMDQCITSWSPGAVEIFGYSQEEILGQHPRILFTPEDRASVQSEKELKTTLEYGHVEDERWHIRKNGERFWGSGMTMLLRDHSGHARGYLKVMRDLTERHRRHMEDRAQIRQQEALVRFGQYALTTTKVDELMAKAISVATETLGLEYGMVLEWQPEAGSFRVIKSTGWDQSDLMGVSLSAAPFSHALYTLKQNQAVVVENFDSEARFHFRPEEPPRIKSGAGVVIHNAQEPLCVLMVHSRSVRPFHANEIQFLEAAANILADAVHHRKVEEALRKSEERFRMAVEGVLEYAIYMLDAEGKVATYNIGAERLEGYQPEEIVGKPLSTFFPPEDVAKGVPEQELLRAQTEGRSQTEGWCVRKDGSRFLSNWVLTAVRDESGNLTGYCKVARDVTAIRETEERSRRWNAALEERVAQRTRELRSANQELEAFNYSVSHDLRAPLRHINAFVSILQRTAGKTLPSDSREYLNIIAESAQQLGALVDDLLSFSRMGRQEMRRVPVRLSWLVEEAQKQLKEEGENREVEWVIAVLPVVEGDPVTLRQVFINLLSNALKYTSSRARARIEIGAIESENETICYVRDNGVGFDMQYAHKLFGVFQRLHSADEFEGTGIGLAIVQRVVQRHGGRVWAEGEVDKGATFYFSLPKKTVPEYDKKMDSDRRG